MTDSDPPMPMPNLSNVFARAALISANAELRNVHFKVAAGFYALQGKSAAFAWNPEEQLPIEERRIITPQEFRSFPALIQVDVRLLQLLDQQPERILSLDSRQFERLVTTLLEGLGYRTVLSPVGRDGGVDIVADRMTDIGPELVLVQCKRFAASKKVSQPTVKQLCMDVEDRDATRGLIVTTSTFTSVALKYIEVKKHRVSGADRGKLEQWVRDVLGKQGQG
jgi:restriction endonuclease Mrr